MKKIIRLKSKTEAGQKQEFMKATAKIWKENPNLIEMVCNPITKTKIEVVYNEKEI